MVRRLILLVAALALLIACAGPSPSPSPRATVPVAPSAPPSAATTTSWTVVPPDTLGPVALGPAAVAGDGSLLALGRSLAPTVGGAPTPPASIWTSPDGVSWTRGADSEAFVSVRERWDRVPLALVRTDAGFVAAGMTQLDDGSAADAAAWFSADGVTWRPVLVGEGSGRTIDEVVRTERGLVAVGDARYDFHAGFGDGTAIWTSPDGRSWTRLMDDAAPPRGVRLHDVTRTAGGWLSLARAELTEGDDGLARRPLTDGIWRSDDAIHWAPIEGSPLDLVSMAGDAQGVAALGRRPAAGGGEGELPVIWRSTDGAVWTSAPLPIGERLPADESLAPTRLVAGDAGWIAFAEPELEGGSVGWFSADGATWAPLGALPEAAVRIDGVTAFGSSFLVTGRRGDPGSGFSVPTAWVLTR